MRLWLVSAIASSVYLVSSVSAADWPMPRHDAQRTGAATGQCDMTDPTPYWKAYVGGTIGGRGAMAADVTGDGVAEIVFAGGGRLFARRPDDTTVWETPLIGVDRLEAARDMDGDGVTDIVARSSGRVFILNGKTGAVEWAEDPAEMGTIAGVRVADLDGDKKPDLFVQECGCCAVKSGTTGLIYSFANGSASPKVIWTLPFIECAGGASMTVADVNGDSNYEVVLGAADHLEVLDGATGALFASSPVLGDWLHRSRCLPFNVDGTPGEELVCELSSNLTTAGTGHRIFVLHYSATPMPAMDLLWQAEIGDVDNGVTIAPGFVDDLDGDGQFEVTASGTTTSNAINAYILDAATGAALAVLPDAKVAGTAHLQSANKALLLTKNATSLSAWSFDRTKTPPEQLEWSLPDLDVVTATDWSLSQRTSLQAAVDHIDITGDGLPELLTHNLPPAVSKLIAYTAPGAQPSIAAKYTFEQSVDLLQAWVTGPVDRPYPEVMVASTDGYLRVLDQTFAPTTTPGITLGGYYASGKWGELDSQPVIASLGDSTGEAILVPDSRGALVRLDASNASFASPPTVVWQSLKTNAPVVVPQLDGSKPGIGAVKILQPVTVPPHYQIAALRNTGTPIWIVPIDQQPLGGLVPGRLNGDSAPDFFVQWGDPADTILHTRGISGATGSTLWDATPVSAGANRKVPGAAATDWDGDGRDDLVYQFYGTRVLSGSTGQEIASGTSVKTSYYMTTLGDVDGDQKDEVILHGSFAPARALDDDLSTVMWTGPQDRPYPYGAIARCGGQTPPRLVEGSYNQTATLRITDLSGTSVGSSSALVLAGGKLFADEAAANAAGVELGQLSSVSVHQDLTGLGRPTAVVGSSDGWLYGVDPCSGALDFARDFGAPVGAVAFGDTNGDGLDEMVVSVADGYLYGMKQQALEQPKSVIDTDPPAWVVNTDVDDITTTDTLYGAWSAVGSADSYEVSIVDQNGTIISAPAWQNVGNVTSVAVSGLSLTDGERYRFAVRAVKGTAPSPDGLSDGVVFHFPNDAGSPEGGGVDGSAGDTGVDADAQLPVEAGADAGDAGFDSGLPGAGRVAEGGGCGCSLPRPAPRGAFWAALLMVVAGVGFKRRRSVGER